MYFSTLWCRISIEVLPVVSLSRFRLSALLMPKLLCLSIEELHDDAVSNGLVLFLRSDCSSFVLGSMTGRLSPDDDEELLE